MDLKNLLRGVLGLEMKDSQKFRCIHCGDEFETAYYECPSCGTNHVVEVDD